MPDRRDPRYRGRRRTSAQRRPGHLRTNYVEDDIQSFANDLERLRSVWSESEREGDRKAERRQALKTNGIICLVVMVPVTALLVYLVLDGSAPWWAIPPRADFFVALPLGQVVDVPGRGHPVSHLP